MKGSRSVQPTVNMPSISRLGFALVLLSCFCSVSAVYKRWLTTTDFDNPKNWDLGHLPCPNDHVIFPASAPVVAINQDWTLSNMVLSNDGIIVLADDMIISFNDNPSLTENCQNPKDIRYNFTTPSHWLDPAHWCLPMHDFDTDCFEGILQMHTEMVPCQTDDVLFPGLLFPEHRSSFYVSLDLGASMKIGTLKIGNWFYSTSSFKEYLDTDFGRKEFVQESGSSPSALNMTTRICVDPAGCYCGTNASPWKEKICSFVGTCPTVNCHVPITPTGHCCPLCGARLEMEINSTTYNTYQMRDLLNNEYIRNKNKGFDDVIFDISRLENGNSQLAMTDNSNGATSSRLAIEIDELIEKDISGDSTLGVLSITSYTVSDTSSTTSPQPSTVTAGKTSIPHVTTPLTPPTNQPTKQATTSGKTLPAEETTTTVHIAGTVHGTHDNPSHTAGIMGGIAAAVCVLLLGIVGVVCFFSLKRSKSSFNPMSVSISFDDNGNGVSGGSLRFNQGLDNPLYGDEELGDVNGVPLSNMTPEGAAVTTSEPPKPSKNGKKSLKKKKSTGFENPVYFDKKTETVGSADAKNGEVTIANPIFDDELQPDIVQFEDNFM